MNFRCLRLMLLTSAVVLSTAGCSHAPGKPGLQPESLRPSQILNFSALYEQNCAGCHGVKGSYGAAISLANPVYLAFAGASNIASITAAGVPGTLMPPFSKSSGGMLTDQQIQIIAQGVVSSWGNPAALGGQAPPPYASGSAGNPANGPKAFEMFCARCHGAQYHRRRRASTGNAGLAFRCHRSGRPAYDRSGNHRHRCVAGQLPHSNPGPAL